ncbi:Cyclic-AMP phosphodiesterase, class-II [Metarhizium album ARSEF 1941]|uniref:Cyclic-AMP phosphodiesterase, class-II n=1 Tax=Metarhizium album (strain ARSEF 1941) TaxID=1081103 RepID=A0A0B2X1F0_METAS|nr:Cyclic-AMP phosphodiesterase, class-II [Metarhizium album ARSEF 1941]KHN99689.1 Cyclic-AMP phosphodiesterase, class-II [Metarhizium album ARSEF 1941]
MGEIADPALQVIILGSGGGPQESNITAFLVRSVAQRWSKGSIIAVDAGVHLSAITRLLQESYPSTPPANLPFTLSTGAFAGLELPYASAAANAAHVTGSLVDTYLITHPHLDHISGFVINTAGLPGTRPKKLAGLPSTIHAFKKHIFNNVIWPNLSDENNGAGLLTYLRLVEGGSPALGDGEAKGYMEVCDGLLVKTWSVSHGHCIEKHPHRGSASSVSTRFGSHDASSQTPRRDIHQHSSMQHTPKGPGLLSQAAFSAVSSPQFSAANEPEKVCVYDSSAYFIRDQSHRREILIFGDVEPDSLSLSPRNLYVWQEAASRVVSGILSAIFIECSYDDSQSNDRLFGHLKPYFIMDELRALANEVEVAQKLGDPDSKKRKRSSIDDSMNHRRNPLNKRGSMSDDPVSPKSVKPAALRQGGPSPDHVDTPHLATPTDQLSLHHFGPTGPAVESKPLDGLKVVIIHVKERLEDGPRVGDRILQQLQDYEKEMNLGCEFVMSKSGMSFYF